MLAARRFPAYIDPADQAWVGKGLVEEVLHMLLRSLAHSLSSFPGILLVLVSVLLGVGSAAGADQQGALEQKLPVPVNLNSLRMFVNDNRHYLDTLKQTRDALDQAQKDRGTRDILLQMVAFQSAQVGRYQKAMEYIDRRKNTIPILPAGPLSFYDPVDALDAVSEAAGRHQVVMINEASHMPMHRAFTLRLLERLHRRGFRYLAVEALNSQDDALQGRGYPLLRSGAHLAEPVYADLVRTALDLGYEVVPYEYEVTAPPDPGDDPLALQTARAEGQAKNLQERILAKNPKARILVHAGYGMSAKGTQTFQVGARKTKLRLMAGAFQALTRIEPFSIEQSLMSEHSKVAQEAADFRVAISRGLVRDRPVVLRNHRTGEYYVPSWIRESYDLVIFHPRSRYEKGRPTWLGLGGRRKPCAVRTALHPPKGSTYLAQAFAAREEGAETVPVDQMEYGADEPIPTLWLPKGNFRIRIVDGAGKALQEYARKDS